MTLYPFLFAILPPLFLLAVNIQQVHTLAAWRLVLGSLLLGLPVWLTFRRRKGFQQLTRPLNIAAACALFLPVAIIAWYGLPRDVHLSRHAHASNPGPDYYFIVLDSYTSHTELLERFGYDDSPFLNGLAALGFSTGECTSPGTKTDESLAAMLNGGTIPEGVPLWQAISRSQLRTDLEAQGYQTWSFSTGFVWTEILDANRYIQPPTGPLTEIEALYLSPFRDFLPLTEAHGERYRVRTRTILSRLPEAAADPGSQFVFAHIVTPHPPFVFDAGGAPLDWTTFRNPDYIDQAHVAEFPEYLPGEYARGYLGQVEFIGAALLPALQEIIQNSADRPYILVTGDHGAWYPQEPDDPYKILCAEYK